MPMCDHRGSNSTLVANVYCAVLWYLKMFNLVRVKEQSIVVFGVYGSVSTGDTSTCTFYLLHLTVTNTVFEIV